VAAVYDPADIPGDRVAFENHLNYYHLQGSGLPATVARGLAAFLNSTLVDSETRGRSPHHPEGFEYATGAAKRAFRLDSSGVAQDDAEQTVERSRSSHARDH